jgi:hypothetical protein
MIFPETTEFGKQAIGIPGDDLGGAEAYKSLIRVFEDTSVTGARHDFIFFGPVGTNSLRPSGVGSVGLVDLSGLSDLSLPALRVCCISGLPDHGVFG